MKFVAKGLFALFFTALCSQTLCAQNIQIVLINGKTGQPITDKSVLTVQVGPYHSEHDLFEVPTDKHGIAQFRLTNKDSEINVDECNPEQEDADWKTLQEDRKKKDKEQTKKDEKEYVKKFKECQSDEVKKPIVKYDDLINVSMFPGDMSYFKRFVRPGAPGPYVTCWDNPFVNGATNFSTKDVLEKGIVTENHCGKATATPIPGQLTLFVRFETARENWEMMN